MKNKQSHAAHKIGRKNKNRARKKAQKPRQKTQTKTAHWLVDEKKPNAKIIAQAGALIRNGKLVAFPTETVYGLGANALDAHAVKKIFEAKGRPSDNPVIVHIAKYGHINKIAKKIPHAAKILAKKFWPGPLTIVVPKKSVVPNSVTGGLSTVAVRMPDHPVALALLRAANVPIAAPSANRSTKPSPTRARHVLEDLNGRIDGVLDAGPARIGVESTVVAIEDDRLVVLRPGGLAIEELEKAGFVVELDAGQLRKDAAPKSPGMKYRHYAPEATVALFARGFPEHKMRALVKKEQKDKKRVAILSMRDWNIENAVQKKYANAEQMARELFDDFRTLDQLKTDRILIEHAPATGLGLAVNNRAKKAAQN